MLKGYVCTFFEYFKFLFYIIMSPYILSTLLLQNFVWKLIKLIFEVLVTNKVSTAIFSLFGRAQKEIMGRIGDPDWHFEYIFVSAKMSPYRRTSHVSTLKHVDFKCGALWIFNLGFCWTPYFSKLAYVWHFKSPSSKAFKMLECIHCSLTLQRFYEIKLPCSSNFFPV